MNTSSNLDPDFVVAVRYELAAIGTKGSWLQRHQRNTRLVVAGIVALAIVAATTGAAVVAGSFPGSTTVISMGNSVTVTRTGTHRIDLGPNTSRANTVIVDVTCISHTGNISVASTDGFSVDASGHSSPEVGFTQWNCAKRLTTVRIRDGYLAPGGTSVTVKADPGTTWKASARYASSTTSPFAVNANGQTYGAPNAQYGLPDLQGAQATNGRVGFIYTKQFDAFRGTGCINVYKSDGTTVIGKFSIGVVSCAAKK